MNIKFITTCNKEDPSGTLYFIEGNKQVPFEIKRIYHLMQLATYEKRGGHAHKTFIQAAFCLQGTCKFLLDNGQEQQEVILTSPQQGILLEPMIWHEMYDFSDNCIISILANAYYNEQDYIRNYQNFLAMVKT